MSPRAVTRLLSHMAASKNGAAWLSLLPVGGEDGTLANRLCCVSDASAAKQVRAKTGTSDAGRSRFPAMPTAGLADGWPFRSWSITFPRLRPRCAPGLIK